MITASIASALASVIAAVISAIAAVIVARINARQEKQNKEITEHNERREQEAVLFGDMISALCDLTTVTAEAVRGGHTNGNLEEAQRKVAEAEEAYDKFLMDLALGQLKK